MATRSVNLANDDLLGTDSNDTLTGDWRDNEIYGLRGEDLIIGDGSGDELHGGDDNDQLFGQSGDDLLFGDNGDDKLDGGEDHDELHGGDNNDELRGGKGDDELYGDSGDDLLIDTEGVDRIEGGVGNDTITVRGGDAFRFDRVSGGSGNDTINAAGSKVLVSGGEGNDVIFTDLHGDKVLSGGAGSDRFVISTLSTSAGRVIDILGGEGAVETTSNIFGYEGISRVTPGTDTSIDTLDLSQLQGLDASFLDVPDVGFVDKVSVNLGTGLMTHIFGTVNFGGSVPTEGQVAKLTGIENVIGSNGGDGIVGNAAANNLQGLNGEDFIDGSGGNDTIDGGAHNDVLKGGAGLDTILGGSGDDVIYGDAETGGVFADTLTGGTGSDRFVFTDVGKGITGVLPGTGPGVPLPLDPIRDRITDFDAFGSDHDVIDLSAVLDNRSTFTGTTVQQAFAQGFIFLSQESRGTVVKVDLNGGAHTDTVNVFEVAQLEGVSMYSLLFQRNELFLV